MAALQQIGATGIEVMKGPKLRVQFRAFAITRPKKPYFLRAPGFDLCVYYIYIYICIYITPLTCKF